MRRHIGRGRHVPLATVLLALIVQAANSGDAVKPDAVALAKRVDDAVNGQLAAEKVVPSARAGDAEFVRRVSLDLTGVIPPAEKVASFLDSTDPSKRATLIEELLTSPRYGRHLADTWQRLMLPRDSDNRRLQAAPFVQWLEEKFNANTPWDRMVRDLLTATGTQEQNGAVTYFLANPTTDKMTDSVSKLFLGVQLQCAQCHNHPFTTYKQNDYWAMAAFFTKVRADRVNKAAKNGDSPGINESGRGKAARLPESAKTLPAKFLQGEQPKLKGGEPYRPVLADWVTSPRNPFFARAMVNRVWAQLFGRGLVHPVDDMHAGNAPSHPELLQELADAFTASGFDVKFLFRAICNSEAYQRSSKPAGDKAADERLFASMAVKPMTPEQLYDSLASVLGPAKGQGDRPGKGGMKGLAAGPREQFVAFFQADESAGPTDYHAGIPQVLRLMNSREMNATPAVVGAVARGGKEPAKVIEQIYLTTLSRRPTAAEAARLDAYVAEHKGEPRQAYGDVLWALLNSSEFALNH